eukprot:1713605-Rhodomonas_salina.1
MDPLAVFHIDVIARDASGRTALVTLPVLVDATSAVPLDVLIHTEFISPSISLDFSYSTPTYIFRTSSVSWRICSLLSMWCFSWVRVVPSTVTRVRTSPPTGLLPGLSYTIEFKVEDVEGRRTHFGRSSQEITLDDSPPLPGRVRILQSGVQGLHNSWLRIPVVVEQQFIDPQSQVRDVWFCLGSEAGLDDIMPCTKHSVLEACDSDPATTNAAQCHVLFASKPPTSSTMVVATVSATNRANITSEISTSQSVRIDQTPPMAPRIWIQGDVDFGGDRIRCPTGRTPTIFQSLRNVDVMWEQPSDLDS